MTLPIDATDQGLHRGDLLKIVWVDISEDSTGDPETATLSRRTSYGVYWARREDRGIPVLVTTNTLDDDVRGQNGYCIYPEAVVVELTVVKRARRQRKSRRPAAPADPIAAVAAEMEWKP